MEQSGAFAAARAELGKELDMPTLLKQVDADARWQVEQGRYYREWRERQDARDAHVEGVPTEAEVEAGMSPRERHWKRIQTEGVRWRPGLATDIDMEVTKQVALMRAERLSAAPRPSRSNPTPTPTAAAAAGEESDAVWDAALARAKRTAVTGRIFRDMLGLPAQLAHHPELWSDELVAAALPPDRINGPGSFNVTRWVGRAAAAATLPASAHTGAAKSPPRAADPPTTRFSRNPLGALTPDVLPEHVLPPTPPLAQTPTPAAAAAAAGAEAREVPPHILADPVLRKALRPELRRRR